MAHLTRPTKYNIEDSNIALLGSDVSGPPNTPLSQNHAN